MDQELVQRITDAVLRALGQSATTAVRPPVGVCTGDYSKFPELAGKIRVSPPAVVAPVSAPDSKEEAAGSAAGATGAAAAGTVLTGVVTAGRLKGLRGVIYIAESAMRSPLAMDEIRERGLTVVRVKAADVQPPTARWTWWMQGDCPSVRQLVQRRAVPPVDGVQGSTVDQLAPAVGRICRIVESGRLTHGVLFVPQGAMALCLANKTGSLRAIAGNSAKAVAAGAAGVGANLLVVEYAHHTYAAMDEMVTVFLSGSGKPPASWPRQLQECGA